MTTEEWVHKINQLAGEIEDYMRGIHPTAWDRDEYLKDLNEKYRKLARREPDDERKSA